jgi:hypothetical protein
MSDLAVSTIVFLALIWAFGPWGLALFAVGLVAALVFA